ncbi:MAG TPA: hypothetical protein VFK41_10965 [Nocardioidaceae bacterium]|nr:hypothetical protein [Nocardioidaceae bacterium]
MRRLVLALLTLALISGGLAQASTSLWSGYEIDATRTADSGFIGARLVDGKVSYRIDPDARRLATEYRRVRRVTGEREVARAAWILSKYGALQLADQAAAVDVAVYALLAGKPLAGKRASSRLRQTGRAEEIRMIARQLLALSRKYAGPYTFTLTTQPAAVGGTVPVRLRVTSFSGEPVPNLQVLLTLPGVAETHETNAKGRVATSFPAEEVGARRLTAKVSLVPDWRLSVRRPVVAKASRIALAGRKTTLRSSIDLIVRATPVVTVPDEATPRQTGTLFAALFSIEGSDGFVSRDAVLSLYGPFLGDTTPGCSGPVVRTTTATVTGDGGYRSAAVAVPAPGRYVWRVQVPETTFNAPAEACGGLVRVRIAPRFTLNATAGPRLAFSLADLPAGYDDAAVLKLFGPYARRADATCKPGKKVGQVEVRVNRNGDYAPRRIEVSKPGVYAWRIQLPEGDLVVPTQTRCGVKGSFSDVG